MMEDIETHIPRLYIQYTDFEEVIELTQFDAEITYIDAEDTKDIKDRILDGTVDLLVVFDSSFLDAIIYKV